MHPRRRPSKPDTAVFSTSGSYELSLQATVDGKGVATGRARRHGPLTAGVAIKQLRPPRDTVYGDLVLPKDASARRPAVLVFGDSEGGLDRDLHAALLAAHGYPSLALAYFKEPGLPPTLADIPLEYFISAATLLRRQPGVDPAHVFVMGVSRGGEAALLLGAYFPDKVNGVIAGVPSSSVKRGWPDTSRAAWTLHGQELQAGDVISVERIRGPVLLACGGKDLVWSSCLFTDTVTTRLKEHRFRYPVISLNYPDAGHFVGVLSTSYTGFTQAVLDPVEEGGSVSAMGGTVAADQVALADGHRKVLGLLASQ